MNISVVDQVGRHYEIPARAGASIMEAIRLAGLPIAAQCGGCCSCATCHVYVEESDLGRLPPMTEEEEALLELAVDVRPSSRLSCQLTVATGFDGLKVQLAPGTES